MEFANVDNLAPGQVESHRSMTREADFLKFSFHLALVAVFEVDRVHGEGVHREAGVLEPHGGAVEVDQHPLVGVEVERVGQLDPVEERSELGTNEGRSGIGCVHMQPEAKLVANRSNLQEVVEGTGGGGAEGGDHTEGDQSTLKIFLCCSFNGLSAETEVGIRLKKPHSDTGKQACSLHTGVSLFRSISHQP